MGLATIDTFTGFHVRTSQERAKLQFEVSAALEQMTKEISKAVGNEVIYGPESVIDADAKASGDDAVHVYVDSNGNGQRDALGTDHLIVYRYTGNKGNAADQFQIWFCGSCDNKPCNNCNPNWGTERLAYRITSFNVTKPNVVNSATDPLRSNFVTVTIRACWDTSKACDPSNPDPNNPIIEMTTDIRMPAVSTN